MTRTDEGSLLIHADPARIWAALTDPRAWERWLPPRGMSARVEWFDPHPGGGYRMVLRYRDAAASAGKTTADADVVEGRFVAVDPGRLFAQEVDFVSEDPRFAGTMLMTWELTARDDGATSVVFRAERVPAGIDAVDHAQGLAESLVGLARYLAD